MKFRDLLSLQIGNAFENHHCSLVYTFGIVAIKNAKDKAYIFFPPSNGVFAAISIDISKCLVRPIRHQGRTQVYIFNFHGTKTTHM